MEDKNNGLSTTLSEKQSEFLKENFKKMSEQELFQKIQEIGPKTDEKTFAEGFHAVASKLEAAVFGQEVSESELASVAGGLCGFNGYDDVKSRNINTALTTARISFTGIVLPIRTRIFMYRQRL